MLTLVFGWQEDNRWFTNKIIQPSLKCDAHVCDEKYSISFWFWLTACTCSGHANICHMHTGKCFCTTKGIKGDQCQL